MRVAAERRVDRFPSERAEIVPGERRHIPEPASPCGRGRRTASASPLMRGVGLGDDDQPGGVLVEPVDDARPLHAADARQRLAAMADQRIDQRAVGMAGRRMDDEPRRLVDDDEMLVLEDDVERNVLAGDGGLGGGGASSVTTAPAASLRAGSAATAPSIAHAARLDQRLQPGAGKVRGRRRRGSGRAARRPRRRPRSVSVTSPRAPADGCAARRRPRAGGDTSGPKAATMVSTRRPLAACVRVERAAHRRDMCGLVAAAAADDSRARIDREPRVIGHQLRRAGIVDMRAMPLRHAGVGLGDDVRLRPRAVMPSTETSRSAAPTPQLAPKASGAASKPSNNSA